MKTLLLLMLFSISCFGQSLTEKWDSLMKRYNYYNSSGTLVGYKEYDKYDKAWKYYDVQQQVKQPRTDENFNVYAQSALMREQKYQANKVRVQNTIDNLYAETAKLLPNSPKKDIDNINYMFYDIYVKPIGETGHDLSQDSIVNQIINNLISSYNESVRDVITN